MVFCTANINYRGTAFLENACHVGMEPPLYFWFNQWLSVFGTKYDMHEEVG